MVIDHIFAFLFFIFINRMFKYMIQLRSALVPAKTKFESNHFKMLQQKQAILLLWNM